MKKVRRSIVVVMMIVMICMLNRNSVKAEGITDITRIELKQDTTSFFEELISDKMKGQLSQSHKEDVYQFSVFQKGMVQVVTNIQKKYEDKSKYAVMKLQILDENMNPMDKWFYVQGDAWGVEKQQAQFYMEKGVYYLRVAYCENEEVIGKKKVALQKNQENEVSYHFVMSFRPKDYFEQNCFFKNGCVVREKKDKALMYDSEIYALGYGVLGEGKYRIDLPKDGKLIITTAHQRYIHFKIYRKNGKLVQYLFQGEAAIPTSDLRRKKTQISLKKGTYYLEVTIQDSYYSHKGSRNDGVFSVSYSDGPLQTCKLKKTAADTITVKAKVAGGLKGYEIRYKEGTFGKWKNVTVSGNKNLSKSLNGLKKGVTYTVQIRTYCSGEYKKQYSKWSDKMKVSM